MRSAVAALITVLAVLGLSAPPAAATPGPASAPEYWFDSWHLPSLWAAGARGQGVTIAEIDTGVNASLPELAGRVLPGTDLGEHGDGRTDREISGFGHGTAMASIMVGRPGVLNITGIAPGAKILPIAVPLDGTTDAGQPDHLPTAIRYAADHGAKIISMSLGGRRTPSLNANEPCPADEQAAVLHALDKGAIVIASVGNTGPHRNVVEEPGVCLGVVSVGAVDATGAVAKFSSREPYLTLAAPGVDIPSLGRVAGQAYSGNGTSQATAIVSAVLALVWSRYPSLSGRAVVARMLATLDARHAHPSSAYGYGLLDGYRAVTASVPSNAANPVWTQAEPFLQRTQGYGRGLGPAPQPAATTVPNRGAYSIGSAPRLTSPQVVHGSILAGTGLLLLAVLAVLAWPPRRRRRNETAPLEPAMSASSATASRPRPRPGPVTDPGREPRG